MVNRRTAKPKAKSKPKSNSRVNEAGNYTKPTMRKRLFEQIKAGGKGGKPFILAVFPRTRNTKITDGKFGTLSGFYGALTKNKTLSGEFNDQIGPATPGVTAVGPD